MTVDELRAVFVSLVTVFVFALGSVVLVLGVGRRIRARRRRPEDLGSISARAAAQLRGDE